MKRKITPLLTTIACTAVVFAFAISSFITSNTSATSTQEIQVCYDDLDLKLF